ncbi:MAG: hypothetical protein JST49_05925, partial [Bacteroidetes bacterium]|nr:hypothetical protein [Bacteroidota bacterium]
MKTIVAFCLCLYSLCATAQKHDYVWLSGYDSHVGYNPQDQWHTGTTVLDFNVQPVAVGYDSIYMNFDFTNVSFCDSSGNLLFYSNGMYIANSLGDTIENGNNINAGVFHDLWESEETGYRAIQGILALPVGGLRDKYTLLHTFYENSQNVYAFVKSILMSQVDMAANMGFGKIDFTNQALMADVLGQSISATKHGNGADWWVIAQKRNTNCFYKIKVDRFGVAVSDTQCLGAIFEFGSLSTSCFSSDGSKYIHLNTREGLNIYDFDRCSGLLS